MLRIGGLLALSVIPVFGGTARLIEMSGGPELIPADARFAASPVPLVVHIVAAVAYLTVGALQFSPRLRRAGWHRRAGRALAPLGLAVALSARDIARHRAWMIRAYALGLGAGTQAFTVGFGEAAFGTSVTRTDLMMGAAWAINLAIAEWFIRRPVRRTRVAFAVAS